MVTFSVFDRVFFVHGLCYGTAFTVDIDDRQYLISARHVVGDDKNIDRLEVFHEESWKRLDVTFVGSGRGEIDITVLAPGVQLSPARTLNADLGGIILGQDVYFVGYPYKMWSDGGEVMRGRPLPFIKKGTFSAGLEPSNEVKRLFVDAINNEGFSGGPLVFSKPNSVDYKVAGVVSSFRVDYEKVVDKEGEETEYEVPYNTGFLVAYGIMHAVDIIKQNPIGFELQRT